jgi:hypothetical protein
MVLVENENYQRRPENLGVRGLRDPANNRASSAGAQYLPALPLLVVSAAIKGGIVWSCCVQKLFAKEKALKLLALFMLVGSAWIGGLPQRANAIEVASRSVLRRDHSCTETIRYADGSRVERTTNKAGNVLMSLKSIQSDGSYTESQYFPDGQTVRARTDWSAQAQTRRISRYNLSGEERLRREYFPGVAIVTVYRSDRSCFQQCWHREMPLPTRLLPVYGNRLVAVNVYSPQGVHTKRIVLAEDGSIKSVAYFHNNELVKTEDGSALTEPVPEDMLSDHELSVEPLPDWAIILILVSFFFVFGRLVIALVMSVLTSKR